MAVTLTLKDEIVLSQNCLSFQFRETTGGSWVSTGWGASGNPATSAATGATLTILLADGTTVVLGASDGFYPLFPNTDGSLFTVTNVMLGLGATTPIADFIAYITYTVNVSDTPYVVSKYFPIVCQGECCVAKLLAKVDWKSKCDPCDNQALQKWIKAYGMLKSIYADLACDPQLPNDATGTLTTLTDYCNNVGCGCQ